MARKGWTVNYSNYGNLAESFGRAADCIACGQCESVCPQHLPIIELMKKVSDHFDH
jgi:predicted aldo/keto reductase-like oxidoreductase